MNDIFYNYLNKLSESIEILPDKPEETAENTLKALWYAAAGKPISVIKANDAELKDLSDEQIERLDEYVSQRIQGVPLAYITGRQSFLGLEMLAGEEALIPRKETELLASAAIDIAKSIGSQNSPINLIDVCTGAGNVALAIANKVDLINIYVSDLSVDAVSLAKKNAVFLGLEKKVKFFSGDLLDPFKKDRMQESIDIITCNPPYISSSKVSEMHKEISAFEPSLAFDGGAFGINIIRRLISDSSYFLKPLGYLIFEVGLGQAEMIKKQIMKSGFYLSVDYVDDQAGNHRVIIAQRGE